ncbi:hypothetical protein [Marivirga sp.]|uniref:hypothetical protein n=1 Tax=Marivirga sp. TaxID=2018662 RepID=UPI002D80E0F5|nr:hypothetical protein [Marivirga sp.]HET8859212.1 hypothetical protein [Marivirga sp.]
MRKVILILITLLFFSVFAFYFWASSSFNNSDDYNQIVSYHPVLENTSNTFSTMTYNIGYLSGMKNNLPIDRSESLFSDNLAQSIKSLDEHNFDFITLQEIDLGANRSYNYNQFDSLGFFLSFAQGAYAVNWDKQYVSFP